MAVISGSAGQVLQALQHDFGFGSGVTISPEFRSQITPQVLTVALTDLYAFLEHMTAATGVSRSKVLPVPLDVRSRLGVWFGKTGNARVNYSLIVPTASRMVQYPSTSGCNPVSGYAYLLHYYRNPTQVKKLIAAFRFMVADRAFLAGSDEVESGVSFESVLDELCDVYNRAVVSSPNSMVWLMSQVKELRQSHSVDGFKNFYNVLAGSVGSHCEGAVRHQVMQDMNRVYHVALDILLDTKYSGVVSETRAQELLLSWLSNLTDLQILELAVMSVFNRVAGNGFSEYAVRMFMNSGLLNFQDTAGCTAVYKVFSEWAPAFIARLGAPTVKLIKSV